jgi:Family of unknown function (DUF5677)
MNGIQRAIEKQLCDLPVLGLASLLKRKFAQQGVKVTLRRAETIARQTLAGTSTFSLPGKRTESMHIQITDEDSAGIAKWIELFLEKDLQELLLQMQVDIAPQIFKTLKRRWPAECRAQTRELSEFRNRLNQRWRAGIDKLRMLVTMARELGDNINRDARQNLASPGIALVDVLTRLHVRSCQVAEEVIVLLQTGFANGAMARWRTMHEIFVTAAFISEHGDSCAERYRDHQIVESQKGAQEYDAIYARLGYDPIPAEEMDSIRKEYENAIRKHGRTFSGQYGWAAQDLNLKQPTFKDIEKAVGTDHLRGHYRMASHGVHANPKGIFFSMTSIFPVELLLAGPSNSGLADAGDGAALSLLMVSSTLLSLSPTFDHQVALRVMGLLREEIGTAFLRAHQKLHREEEQLRAADNEANRIMAESGIAKKITPRLLREAAKEIERLRIANATLPS